MGVIKSGVNNKDLSALQIKLVMKSCDRSAYSCSAAAAMRSSDAPQPRRPDSEKKTKIAHRDGVKELCGSRGGE